MRAPLSVPSQVNMNWAVTVLFAAWRQPHPMAGEHIGKRKEFILTRAEFDVFKLLPHAIA